MNKATIAKATIVTSLAFHIVFAVLGVGMPLLTAIEGMGIGRRDPEWSRFRDAGEKRWRSLFAVGGRRGDVALVAVEGVRDPAGGL